MPVKMIAVDLDGTLLHSDKTLSAFTQSILRNCREKGIRIVVATGRSEKASERFLPLIEPDAIISCGGALARRGMETLYRSVLTPDTADILLRRCLLCPSARCVTVDMAKGYFSNKPFDPSEPNYKDYLHTQITDFSQKLTGDVHKLVAEIMDRSAAAAVTEGITGISMQSFVGENWYHYLHENATKWLALQAVAGCFGIAPAEIAAFGDDEIDLDMVANCGHGIAPVNARETVKAVAGTVCASHNEDGPAQWMKANLLR